MIPFETGAYSYDDYANAYDDYYKEDVGEDDQNYDDISTSPDDDPLPERDEDGNYVIGDMILNPEQFNYAYGKADDGEVVQSGINGERYRWPGGVVPYEFSRGISK